MIDDRRIEPVPRRRPRDKTVTKPPTGKVQRAPRPPFTNSAKQSAGRWSNKISGREDWSLPRSVSILTPLPAMQKSNGELSQSLQNIADELCTPVTERRDPATAKIMRAIGFFELQVRIFAPDDERLQRQARAIAAIKFLEAIEKKASRSTVRLARFLQLPAYRHLVGLLFAADGWRGIRRLPSTKAFDQILFERQHQCHATASMVGLAYRFRKLNPDSTLTAGKTMAIAVASKLFGSQRGFGKRTLESRLSAAGDFAVLQYLVLEQFQGLRPPAAASGQFVPKLLDQSSRHSMVGFFSAYQDVCHKLRRQFPAEKISNANLGKPSTLKTQPFSENEKKLIRAHYKVKGAQLHL